MTDENTGDIVATRAEAAERLGITPRQLTAWSHEAWFPEGGVEHDAAGRRRNWDVAAIAAAREQVGRKGSELSEAARRLKLQTDHQRLLQAQIKTATEQRRLAQLEGSLIPREALELSMATLLTELGDYLEDLPALVAAEVPKKYRAKISKRLKRELDARRAQTASRLEAVHREFDQEQAAA